MNSSGNTFHEFDVESNLAFKIVLFVSLLTTVASGESSITFQPDFTSFPVLRRGLDIWGNNCTSSASFGRFLKGAFPSDVWFIIPPLATTTLMPFHFFFFSRTFSRSPQ